MSEKKNKGWNNLKPEVYSFGNMSREKHKELSRKGAEKSHQVARERRTAKQALQDILELKASPDIFNAAEIPEEIKQALQKHADNLTMYDILMLVSVGVAAGGNVRALEFVRDSVGDMPVKQMDISGLEIMTEADREMIRHIEERMKNNEMIYVVDEQTGQGKFENVKPDTAAGGEDKEGKGNDN